MHAQMIRIPAKPASNAVERFLCPKCHCRFGDTVIAEAHVPGNDDCLDWYRARMEALAERE